MPWYQSAATTVANIFQCYHISVKIFEIFEKKHHESTISVQAKFYVYSTSLETNTQFAFVCILLWYSNGRFHPYIF